MNAERVTISLPNNLAVAEFSPVAYYDKHMDCIRVLIRDRSVTEHRIDEFFTAYECNHRSQFDPEYVGFAIKGIRGLFDEIGLSLEGAYRLADVIHKIVSHKPGSTMSEMLNLFSDYSGVDDLEIDLAA